MISWRMVAAWLVALVLATVLTWQIVSLADSQVGAVPVVAPSITTTIGETTTTTSTPQTTTSRPGTTTSTSSSGSSSSSSSSAAAAEWSVRTVNTTGGVLVIRYRPEQVELQAATPAPGFSVEIDDSGPDRVRVEFESDDTDVRVEARWENGSLAVEVD